MDELEGAYLASFCVRLLLSMNNIVVLGTLGFKSVLSLLLVNDRCMKVWCGGVEPSGSKKPKIQSDIFHDKKA